MRAKEFIKENSTLSNKDVAEGVMKDLYYDLQDQQWDTIVGYVINSLKKNMDIGRMELNLYKYAGRELFDVDQALEDRGFRDIADLADHIRQHNGKYVPPTDFDLGKGVAEDKIQEIQRTKGDIEGYSTRHHLIDKKTLSKIKMLPGSKRFGYIAEPGASVFTGTEFVIDLYDIKHPSDGVRRVGYLGLRSAPWFPIKKSYQVANVAIDQEYRGQGLGQNLYGIAMKLLGMTIVADDTQTPQARSSWLRLSQVPGVAINGYASLFSDDWAQRNNPDGIYDDDAVRLIRALSRAGGQVIGKSSDFVYVSFPVGVNADKGELQSVQKGIAIYSSQHPESGGTTNGLYARMGEQVKEQGVAENFADGKVQGKSRPGRVKRAGASCSGSVTDLRAKAKKAGGEKGKMYHWCANMKSGKKE